MEKHFAQFPPPAVNIVTVETCSYKDPAEFPGRIFSVRSARVCAEAELAWTRVNLFDATTHFDRCEKLLWPTKETKNLVIKAPPGYSSIRVCSVSGSVPVHNNRNQKII